jgi:hypothetical protein
MSLRQPVSIPSDILDKIKAIRLVQGGTYGEVVGRAVDALLASDPALARRVEGVQKAVAA